VSTAGHPAHGARSLRRDTFVLYLVRRAYPWATREQLVGRLYTLLDSEPGLTAADRLQLREEIEVQAAPEGDGGIKRKRITAVGDRIKAMAPGAWDVAQPVLRVALSPGSAGAAQAPTSTLIRRESAADSSDHG
jgi:hypothetical protein